MNQKSYPIQVNESIFLKDLNLSSLPPLCSILLIFTFQMHSPHGASYRRSMGECSAHLPLMVVLLLERGEAFQSVWVQKNQHFLIKNRSAC